MSANTKIEWTDHTFNPWWGCSRVSPACRFCYADRDAKRHGFQVWRRHGERRMLSDNNWRQPVRWNRKAEKAGVPEKVFCASMADVFEEHPLLDEPRKRLWDLIEATPWLQWQLLTKRPENVAAMAPWGDSWPDHVWLGVSVETMRFANERIPLLLATPAKTRFLSCEPLLEELDLPWLLPWNRAVLHSNAYPDHILGPYGDRLTEIDCGSCDFDSADGISWIICGGESGPKSRPTHLAWVRSLVEQCRSADVAPFVKQLGAAWAKDSYVGGKSVFGLGDRKGGDWEYWPEDLQVRAFPAPATAGAR
jgi:protein gp37